ncbi:MAG: PEP-CTERM sorting domain-containing protein [Akkermansiaceae bacterium]|jgi:hypothetical protein|nr:PEP-CTERM sorting domain-containing protein [Akkermansiaceae bacterium]
MKTLWLAVLLASPPAVVWALRGSAQPALPPAMSAPPVERMAVEVLDAGGGKQWMMVEVAHDAVPEPSSAVLMMLSCLLLLRRQRGK